MISLKKLKVKKLSEVQKELFLKKLKENNKDLKEILLCELCYLESKSHYDNIEEINFIYFKTYENGFYAGPKSSYICNFHDNESDIKRLEVMIADYLNNS